MPVHLSRLIARYPDGSAVPGALIALVTAAVLTASGCSGAGDKQDEAQATQSTRTAAGSNAAGSCRPAVQQGSLPSWARKGFPRDVSRHAHL